LLRRGVDARERLRELLPREAKDAREHLLVLGVALGVGAARSVSKTRSMDAHHGFDAKNCAVTVWRWRSATDMWKTMTSSCAAVAPDDGAAVAPFLGTVHA